MDRPLKTVLITGCSPGGIGNAMAREFHSQGLRVLATARKPESISDLSELGIEALPLELTNQRSIQQLFETVEQLTNGKLDILVNNAGRNYTVPALDVEFDEVEDVFMTNTISVMRMCQKFAPLLMNAKGRIVQIGSAAGVIPYPFSSTYNASKAAMHAYSNTLRVELSPFSVKVVIVMTGRVQSRLSRNKRTLKPDSLYQPIRDEYDRRVEHSQGDAMPVQDFARSLVPQLLVSSPSMWIWEGKQSFSVWFMDRFVSRPRVHSIFQDMFDFKRISKLREEIKT